MCNVPEKKRSAVKSNRDFYVFAYFTPQRILPGAMESNDKSQKQRNVFTQISLAENEQTRKLLVLEGNA